jgi:hypothetical protein
VSFLYIALAALGGAGLGVLGFWLWYRWQDARRRLETRHYGDGDYQ